MGSSVFWGVAGYLYLLAFIAFFVGGILKRARRAVQCEAGDHRVAYRVQSFLYWPAPDGDATAAMLTLEEQPFCRHCTWTGASVTVRSMRIDDLERIEMEFTYQDLRTLELMGRIMVKTDVVFDHPSADD